MLFVSDFGLLHKCWATVFHFEGAIAMLGVTSMSYLVGQLTRFGTRVQTKSSSRYVMKQIQISSQNIAKGMSSFEGEPKNEIMERYPEQKAESLRKHRIGENVSRKDKINFLVSTLLDLKDSKEAVYGCLDAWVAWEQSFPIASLKKALFDLEKEQQWHKVVQVIKWILSKGQGSTMGTYVQLVRALDKDRRAEEAHKFWMKKIGSDLHSVPWQLCNSMICIYYRNNMPERLIKLFKGLEAFDRKPPEKSIVQKVADAYEILGLPEEKERVLEKYKDLFTKTEKEGRKSKAASKKKTKSKHQKDTSVTEAVDDIQ